MKYIKDKRPWIPTNSASPKNGVPIWVMFKTMPVPTYLNKAEEMTDAYWFAEVSCWKYVHPEVALSFQEISAVEFEEGQG